MALPMPITHQAAPEGPQGDCFVYICTLDPTETTGDGAGGSLGQQQQQGLPSLTWIDSLRPEMLQGVRVFSDLASQREHRAEGRKMDHPHSVFQNTYMCTDRMAPTSHPQLSSQGSLGNVILYCPIPLPRRRVEWRWKEPLLRLLQGSVLGDRGSSGYLHTEVRPQ